MVRHLEEHLTRVRIENWYNHDLFTYQWWLLAVVLVIPWLIWWKLVDKKRLLEIIVVGAAALIISSYLDAVLSEFGLWSYNFEIVPVWPRLISADFTALPIMYMLIYQYCPRWKSYCRALILSAAAWSFICEPVLEWLGIYHPYAWKHYYSFPIYIAIGLLIKALVQFLLNHQVRCTEGQSKD